MLRNYGTTNNGETRVHKLHARVDFMGTVLSTNGETILGSIGCLSKASVNAAQHKGE